MFSLFRNNPGLVFEINSHISLGEQLSDLGGRILLICSLDSKERKFIDLFKTQFAIKKLTYIQCNQKLGFINKKDLNKLQLRAENFKVTTIVALGNYTQRMSGRYISQILSLNYFEVPTEFNNPYLLLSQSIYSNRVGNGYETIEIKTDKKAEINIDPGLLRDSDSFDKYLNSISLLLNLCQVFSNTSNNIISRTESKNLFLRLLTDLEEENLDTNELYRYGLTASLYHGVSSNTTLNLTIYSWLSGNRFNLDPNTISAILLPAALQFYNEEELAIRVLELLDNLNLSTRLTNLEITLKQFLDVAHNLQGISQIIEKAF